jgi:hypothetical protein
MALFKSKINWNRLVKTRSKSGLFSKTVKFPQKTGAGLTAPGPYSISNRCCDKEIFQSKVGGSQFAQFNKNGGLMECDCTNQ